MKLQTQQTPSIISNDWRMDFDFGLIDLVKDGIGVVLGGGHIHWIQHIYFAKRTPTTLSIGIFSK